MFRTGCAGSRSVGHAATDYGCRRRPELHHRRQSLPRLKQDLYRCRTGVVVGLPHARHCYHDRSRLDASRKADVVRDSQGVPDSRYPLGGRLLDTEFKVAPGIYATGLSTDEGIRFQGFHGSVLIVIDEAAGLRPDIYEAIEGIRASGDVRVLMLANPTLASGPFYDAFTSNRYAVQTFTIDAFDTPNFDGFTLDDLKAIPAHAIDDPRLSVTVRPYLVTRKWVHEKLYQWGEGSPLWQSRVSGQFPTQSEDALISLAWIEQAKPQPVTVPPPDAPATAGLDVAGPGEDETVLTIRQGGYVAAQHVWLQPDPRGEVLAALAPWTITQANVDSIGVGYYMARHIEDAGYDVVDVNVGEAASDKEKYANLKAELYWGLRQWFEQHDIAGVTDDLLSSQLTGIRYKHNARGQIVIESKEDARKRGVKSPDRAEALMLAFADVQGTEVDFY
jgi:phage terminase large subunit